MNGRPRPPRELLVRFVRTGGAADAVPAERREWDRRAAHALAREMIAERAGCDRSQVLYHSSPQGRPEIVAPRHARTLSFSISYSDGIALCGVAEGLVVGADVQSLREVGDEPLVVAAMICSPREMEAIRALPAQARASGFLSIWTLKEAIAKAMGLGFCLPLDRITIHLKGRNPPAIEFDSTVDDPSRWKLRLWRLAPAHVAAVAARSAPGESIEFRLEKVSGERLKVG